MLFKRLLALTALTVPIVSAGWEDRETPLVFSIEQDESELLSLEKKLIEIPSVSKEETLVADFLKGYLEEKGLTVETIPLDDGTGRYNIYAYQGTTRATKVLLTAHIDTVPPYIPFYVEGDRIYGRGSNDCKGSIASQLTALFELQESGAVKEGDVSVLLVVGEEIGGDGMHKASATLGDLWDTVIFGEPTENKLAVGHKGIYMFKVKVTGKAAHSGYPELGIDANRIMIKLAANLYAADWPISETLGETNVNIGTFSGGVAGNVVSPYAEFTTVIRNSADSETIDAIVGNAIGDQEHVDFELVQKNDPVYLNYKVPGFDSFIASYSTDVPFLNGNFTRYLYGPGSILVAHSDHEYVTFDSLKTAVEGYKTLITYSL
ncbi:unnamed protein product [Kuraishia capsulata CBS 1993]|uniref:Peptidase M20 dimerisation domain-containing protein n=1 Tax=Kuraishia capsulata CBS 1993 TaxID=1382522 RepID=W6MIW4_9ASCO|nr:uncharacterized protein KUCA_T00002411001 [Kuraishia capsulata CBS 1993]CDK26439.1 unnamed protein product [Kuraishia capsulata CBS 1993]